MVNVPDGLLRGLAGRYRIEREIGSGGMATVYLAADLRHGRRVAIKVLRPDVAEALGSGRFTREIEIAAGLTHPHILPLHDSGEVDGLLYYVMPFMEGESLQHRLAEEGALPVPDAARIFRDIVGALGAAHAHGVVHRDVKPANVLLADGHALVADFGVAKALSEAAGERKETTAGVAVGTLRYMSPEQAGADPATDHRADLFAAGVVVYEMLTGVSPFAAPTTQAVFAALLTQTPEHPSRVREGVPEALGDIILWCLEKDPADRPQNAAEVLGRLDAVLTPPAGMSAAVRAPGGRRRLLTPGRLVAALLIVVVAGVGGWRFLAHQKEVRWARQEGLPEVLRLAEEGQLSEAAALALRVERVLGEEPVLEPVWRRVTTHIRVDTEPPGATVSWRPWESPDTAWVTLGTTPYETDRFPVGTVRFRVALDGYETVEAARALMSAFWLAELRSVGADYLSDPSYGLDFELVPVGSGPPGMIRVTGGLYLSVPIGGFASVEPIEVPTFWIDRTEVTNAAYREFVEAGAYADSTLWPDPFLRDGATVPWRTAMAGLVDATGRPGPSTWVLNRPPDGHDEYPVGGVSWYEASAYCAWRGKSLPTLFHWARAAVSSSDPWSPFHPSLVATSNMESDGPVPVGSRNAIGITGAQDVAGNVREWVSTASGANRHIAGGAWNDPGYAVHDLIPVSPWVRLPTEGFRCALYPEGSPPESLLRSIDLPEQDLSTFTPTPDAVFEASKSAYAYDRSQPLADRVDSTSTSPTGAIVEWVSVDASYGGRLPMRLYVPDDVEPPYGAVIYFPGSNLLLSRQISPPQLSFVTRAGRMLVEPVFDGGYNRNDGSTMQRYQSTAGRAELISHWVQDLGRVIDYLEERGDVNPSGIAFAGLSMGATLTPWMLPYEPRIRAAILLSGGLSPQADQASIDRTAGLAGHIRIPVLMLGGNNDFSNPISHQEALFRALGTPADQKRFRTYENAGHWPLPMTEVMRETVEFLDRYAPRGGDPR